jgi:ribosome-binding protein aMBF1 (putative translation factor)
MARPSRSFKKYLSEQLKNKEFKTVFEEEKIFSDLAIQIAQTRQKENLTQKDLAKMLNTSQQNVSRLEDPYNRSFSLRTLIKLARVLKRRLVIELTQS